MGSGYHLRSIDPRVVAEVADDDGDSPVEKAVRTAVGRTVGWIRAREEASQRLRKEK